MRIASSVPPVSIVLVWFDQAAVLLHSFFIRFEAATIGNGLTIIKDLVIFITSEYRGNPSKCQGNRKTPS
jgi:hypothetical protein